MNRPSRTLLLAAALVAALALTPVAYLVMRAMEAGVEGWRMFARPSVWAVFGRSALLASLVTAAAVAIGTPLAWLTVRTDLPLRRFWSVALILPLAMPSYISAYAFIGLLGPSGLVAQGLAPLGVERLPSIYGVPGTALVITLITYPFVMLSVRAALRRLDPALDEAALGLGLRRRDALWRVTLPQLRPAITAGGLLSGLYALSDFGTPALMQCNVFTRVIYTQYRSSFDRHAAALLALMLVVLTVGILLSESVVRGRAEYYRLSSGAQRPAATTRLGPWRWPAFGFCSLVLFAALGLPILMILYWMGEARANDQALHLPLHLIGNSMLAAGLAALVAVLAAFPVVFLAVRYRGRLTSLVDRVAWLGNALPGIVIALALVFLGARHLPFIYQTLPLLILAYTIRFLPESVGSLRSSLLQAPPRIEEAARGLGRTPLGAFFSVTLPLIMPGVLAGAALVFLTTIKELPITLILSPTGYETLVSEIWTMASEGMFARASPAALLLVIVSAFSVAVILHQEGKGRHVG